MTRVIQCAAFLGFLSVASFAVARQVAQPGYTRADLATFKGDDKALIHAIKNVEQTTGGRVVEIRYSGSKNLPGYHAVLAKHGQVEFMRVQQDSGAIVEIDVASTPDWMLGWRSRADVKWDKRAEVTLPTAIRTAEKSMNDAPAVAAGIARSASNPTSDVHAYNVILNVDGVARRVSVDSQSGEIIEDPQALQPGLQG